MNLIEKHQAAVNAGNWGEALECALRIKDAAPTDPTCWFNVGVCYCALGRHMEAAQSFQQVIKIDYDDRGARYRMLRSLFSANQTQIVFDELQQALQEFPGFVSEFFEIEMFQDLLLQGRFTEMLKTDCEQTEGPHESAG